MNLRHGNEHRDNIILESRSTLAFFGCLSVSPSLPSHLNPSLGSVSESDDQDTRAGNPGRRHDPLPSLLLVVRAKIQKVCLVLFSKKYQSTKPMIPTSRQRQRRTERLRSSRENAGKGKEGQGMAGQRREHSRKSKPRRNL